MDKVNSFLSGGGNPLATPVGQLIDKATDQMTPDANLELYFEICDLINLKEENAKDAMKTIRKKISIFGGKNWTVVLKLLLLLETCSNNCNRKFQVLIANKDFLQELKILIGPKFQPPLAVQEKVLYLIQHWTNIFKNDADFKTVESFYNELRSRGVDFPLYDPENTNSLDTMSSLPISSENATNNAKEYSKLVNNVPPVVDNRRTLSNPGAAAQQPAVQEQQLFHSLPPQAFNPTGTVVKLNEEQIAKLKSELDVVDNNVQVLNEILTELQSSTASKSLTQNEKDLGLLIELSKTCREMQKRVTQLIGNISNELVIGELLRVNDDLNSVFLRYERFERSNGLNTLMESPSAAAAGASSRPTNLQKTNSAENKKPPSALFNLPSTPAAAAAQSTVNNNKAQTEKPLIDFNDDLDDTVTQKKSPDSNLLNSLKSMSVNNNGKKADDDFTDMNAFLHDENEIKEMEEWLKSQGHKLNESSGSSSNPSLTASSTKTSINKEEEAKQQ